jgi:hypothetical protein
MTLPADGMPQAGSWRWFDFSGRVVERTLQSQD